MGPFLLLLLLSFQSALALKESTPLLTTSLRGKVFSSTGGRRLLKVTDEEPELPGMDLYNVTKNDLETASVNALEPTLVTSLGFSGKRVNRVFRTRKGSRFTVNIVVAKDGSGHTNSIQDAIDRASPGYPGRPTYIYVKAGWYKEPVVVPSSKKYITMIGVRGRTVVYGDKSAGDVGGGQGTAMSSNFKIYADSFTAIDMTFANTFGFPNGRKGAQAVALLAWADRVSFWSCTFLGHQDTLFAYSGRQYYKSCTIVGSVDFIFGDATAIFDSCTVKFINDKENRYGAVAAQYRQSSNYKSGFVFLGGQLVGKLGSPDDFTYLGRLWGPYCTIVYVRMYMQEIIEEEGWNNMGNPDYEKTGSCFTHRCMGPGMKSQKNWVGWWKEINSMSVRQYVSVSYIDGGLWTRPPSTWVA